MKGLLSAALGVALAAVALAGCGGGGGVNDCGDVAKQFCEKARACGFLAVPVGECVPVFENLALRDGTSDEQCLEEWESVEGMSCAEYQAWFP